MQYPNGRTMREACEAEDSFLLRADKRETWYPSAGSIQEAAEAWRANLDDPQYWTGTGKYAGLNLPNPFPLPPFEAEVFRVLRQSRIGCMVLEPAGVVTV